MPKKKKKSGKAGKLARMTEEDRILYLEQQRLAEEEMRKKKEDMLTQFLKVGVKPHRASALVLMLVTVYIDLHLYNTRQISVIPNLKHWPCIDADADANADTRCGQALGKLIISCYRRLYKIEYFFSSISYHLPQLIKKISAMFHFK